jgi:hydrogenase maturation protein HypF
VTTAVARRLDVRGVVQGVGFRPFVYRLATRLGLGGTVRNTATGVVIEVEGAPSTLDRFLQDLVADAPALAHIDDVHLDDATPHGREDFTIDASQDGDGLLPVSADVATCPACVDDILDPSNRRYGYPFTNCTQCGPRFTIIRTIPYDRPGTTMAGFAMCAECQAEYSDPADRRFHAQPNACATCGPRLRLVDRRGRSLPGNPLSVTRGLLAVGAIVALKGIGGFHLACDATNAAAVQRLRARKRREARPLAVMVPDVDTVRRLCFVFDHDVALLESPARPIVILAARPGSPIASAVGDGLSTLGVMLPYSPVHHLLWRDAPCPEAIVLTSGNRSDEPIATEDGDAMARLGTVADAFLIHDRPIHARCDDSVTRVVDGEEVPIRRARGYAPFPVRLPVNTPPLLACGAELKSTVCLARGRYAFLSPHIGDLANYQTYASYAAMIDHLSRLFRIRPEAVVHDLHPGYLSSRYAESLDPALPRVAVQHHHAHVAACMAEHGLVEPVIGVAFDGTGYGTDGAIWGGEFLVADYARAERVAHLGYVRMPGGDLAVREPFRMALAHLHHAFGGWDPGLAAVAAASEDERRIVARQIERGVNAPLTSSVGRLFDAVASLLGVRHRARYEAQAAIELEALAAPGDHGRYPIDLVGAEPAVVDPAPIIRGVVHDVTLGAPAAIVAARVHMSVAAMIVTIAQHVRERTALDRVVLSGGVFQNVTLLGATRRLLAQAGFRVFSHHIVPPNDGGIALGQAVVAQARLG